MRMGSNPDYRGEVFPSEQVLDYEILSSEIRINLTDTANVTINQNYHPYWETDGTVYSNNGLLGVSPENKRIVLYFRPPYFFPTLFIILTGIVLLCYLFFRFS